MPLALGSDKNVVASNIKELRKSGRSEAQSTAIALKQAGKGKQPSKPKELTVKGAANGGFIVSHRMDNSGSGPYQEPQDHAFTDQSSMLAHVAKHTK